MVGSWGVLEVETFAGHPPEWQAFAAGLAEGSLTKLQISYHYSNTVKGLCYNNKDYCKRLYRYLNDNLEWISAQVDANRDDLYWRQVNLTFNQLTGIFDGYGSAKGNRQQLPESNLIWVLEQIPGTIVSRDVTWFLRKYSYWPSYNIPFLRRVSELSGFDRKSTENNWWRWGFCPRARIFHRDHHKVQDIDGLRALMRYNNYKNDEFSRCACSPPYTAEASISTRGDLNPANGTYELPGMGHRNHGALDYKGTNFKLFKKLRLEVVGGPTYGGAGNLPVFNWETTDFETPHEGQPKIWQFKPFVTQWVTPVNVEAMARHEEEGQGVPPVDEEGE
uniref:Phospholipase B-like n=1 Tax=Globodera pallida TaxID=36090 RepID=A0A183C531_GLOPA